MSRGSYELNQEQIHSRKNDQSHKACIGTLLVFLVLCIIIILVTTKWKSEDDLTANKILSFVDKDTRSSTSTVSSSATHKSTENDKITSTTTDSSSTTHKRKSQTLLENINSTSTSIVSTPNSNEGMPQSLPEDNKTTSTVSSSTTNKKLLTSLPEYNKTASTILYTTTSTSTASTLSTSEATSQNLPGNNNTTPTVLSATTNKILFQSIAGDNETTSTVSATTTSRLKVSASTTNEPVSQTLAGDNETTSTVSTLTTNEATSQSLPEDNQTTSIVSSTKTNKNLFTSLPENNETTSTATNTITSTLTDSTSTTNEATSQSLAGSNKTPSTVSSSTVKIEYNLQPTTSTSTIRSSTINKIIDQKSECNKTVCKTVASRILSFINHMADPCNDFYEFTCGQARLHNWDKTTDLTYTNILNDLKNDNTKLNDNLLNLKSFYTSCLDYEDEFNYTERISTAHQLLTNVGSFHSESVPLDFSNITDLFAQVILLQSMPLFEIRLGANKAASNYTLQLTLPQQNDYPNEIDDWSALSQHNKRCLRKQNSQLVAKKLNLNRIYQSYLNCTKNYLSYLNSVENALREMNFVSKTLSDSDIKNIRMDVEAIYLKLFQDYTSNHDEIGQEYLTNQYEDMTINDLNDSFSVLKWSKLFEILFGTNFNSNDVKIQVYNKDKLIQMFKQLSTFTSRRLNNALLAMFVYDLYKNIVMPTHESDRAQYCGKLSKKLFPKEFNYFLSTRLSRNEDVSSINKWTEDLFEKLKNMFEKSIELNSLRVDQNMNQIVHNKISKLKLALFNASDNNVVPKNLIIESNTFQSNFHKLMILSKQSFFSLHGQAITPKSIFDYFLDPLDAEKPLSFYTNIIAVPFWMLETISTDLPGYLNVAHIGLYLARKIARNFDFAIHNDSGLTNALEQRSILEFKSNMNSQIEQNTTINILNKDLNFMINGSLSVNERFADNAAFRLIFDFFDQQKNNFDMLPFIGDSFSIDQLFAIVVAQGYCNKDTDLLDFMTTIFESEQLPTPLRIDNIMKNSESFSSAFSCPKGSRLNPEEDKLQFPYIKEFDDYNNPSYGQ